MKNPLPLKRITILLGSLLIVFIIYNGKQVRKSIKSDIDQHAKIVSASLWNLDSSPQEKYFNIVAKHYDYETISVIDHDGDTFLIASAPLPGWYEALLLSLKLIPKVHLSAPVIYNGEKIGHITAIWHCKTIYTYSYILFVFFLILNVLYFYNRLLKSNLLLESRVEERTKVLRESQLRFEEMASNMPGVIFQFYATEEGEYGLSYVSDRAENILGISSATENFYERFFSRINKKYQASFSASIAEAIQASNTWEFEGEFIKPSGESIWIHCSSRLSKKGAMSVFNGVVIDMTERWKAENELLLRNRLDALRADVGKVLARAENSPQMLQQCCEVIVKRLEASFARIWTINNESDTLELKASAGKYTHLDGGHSRIPVGKYKIGLIAQKGKPHLTNSVIGDPLVNDQEWAKNEGMVAFAGYPLIINNDTVGVLALFSAHTLSEFTLDALGAVTDEIAIGIRRYKSEESLEKSEEKFRTLFENANDCIFTMQDNMYIDCNPKTLEVFGCTREQIIGKPPHFLSPEFQPDGSSSKEKAVEKINLALSGEPQFFEWRHTKYDGTPFEAEVSLNRVELSGKILLQALVRDVTARKLAEADLKKSEDKQSLILQALPMAFYVAQPFDTYGGVWVSEQIENISGFSSKQFAKDIDLWLSRLHPDDKADALSAFDEISEKGSVSVDYRWKTNDGSYRWFHDEAVLNRDENGDPSEIIGSWLDITDKMVKQESLQLTQHTVDHSATPTFWMTPKQNVIYANDAACNLLEYSKEEMITLPRGVFHPEGKSEYWDNFFPILKTQKELEVEILMRKKGGSLFHAQINATYLEYQGQVYVMLSVLDLTQRKKMEEDLRQAQKMEAIGTLAGGIAHDFNNILSPIFGYTEFALDHIDQPSRIKEDLNEVLRAAERAKGLVRQILTFSRKTEQEMQPLQVSLIVKEVVKLLRSTIPTTIEIQHEITSQQMVLADPTHIHQIVMNLCTNAYHAMRETGGILSVVLKDVELTSTDSTPELQMSEGSYLQLQVADNGYGMEKEVLEKIFDPYFTTKEVGEGTGLGLAVVHGIVEDHNGHIHVYSEPGQGTTFNVYLPVFDDTKTDENNPEKVEESLLGGSEKIMVVDDEEIILKMSKRILSSYGYDVTAFDTSDEALQNFKEDPQRYDLIITDMTMPHMTGAQLAQDLMAIRPDIPVILCTGHSELINREMALSMGIRKYAEKPLAKSTLVEIVREVLDQGGNHAS